MSLFLSLLFLNLDYSSCYAFIWLCCVACFLPRSYYLSRQYILFFAIGRFNWNLGQYLRHIIAWSHTKCAHLSVLMLVPLQLLICFCLFSFSYLISWSFQYNINLMSSFLFLAFSFPRVLSFRYGAAYLTWWWHFQKLTFCQNMLSCHLFSLPRCHSCSCPVPLTSCVCVNMESCILCRDLTHKLVRWLLRLNWLGSFASLLSVSREN